MDGNLEEGGAAEVGELDSVGLLLLLRTETVSEAGGEDHGPQGRVRPFRPGPAQSSELE